MNKRSSKSPRFTALLALLFAAPSAWAYLDPSTGSMILSAIVGLFATVGLAVKTYWYRLKRFVRSRRKQDSDDPAPRKLPEESPEESQAS